MKSVFLVFAVVVFTVVVTLAVAKARWRMETAREVARLNAVAPHAGPGTFAPAMLDSVPAPVARYLRAVLRDGAPVVRHAVIRHAGEFRADTAGAGWAPFRSLQHFTGRTPGFVWDAEIRMAPFVDATVRDELVGGVAAMRARMDALAPVVDVSGTPDLAAAALQRWLAEAAWFPTALLPSPFLRWSAIDDSTARAEATAGGTTASLAFRFGADSLLRFVETPARMRDVKGVGVPTPWRASHWAWQWRGEMRVPLCGEVEWGLTSGPHAYWRGTITDATYE